MTTNFGFADGEVCGRPTDNNTPCKGVISTRLGGSGVCSCHINPPCNACTDAYVVCPECGWEIDTVDFPINDHILTFPKHGDQNVPLYETRRPLNKERIDWYSECHSSSSMLMRGVYPEGTTRQEVEEKVIGTFGGRFESFGNGKFVYIAYTD